MGPKNLRGGCEETTTGVIRLRSRAAAGKLKFSHVQHQRRGLQASL